MDTAERRRPATPYFRPNAPTPQSLALYDAAFRAAIALRAPAPPPPDDPSIRRGSYFDHKLEFPESAAGGSPAECTAAIGTVRICHPVGHARILSPCGALRDTGTGVGGMVQEDVRFCPACGVKQPAGARFCYACGTAPAAPRTAMPGKDTDLSLNATTRVVAKVLIACVVLIVTTLLVCVALDMTIGTFTGHF